MTAPVARAARLAALALLVFTMLSSDAAAQARPAAQSRPAAPESFGFRGFGDLGVTLFSASESFEAVLGSPTGIVFGGGVDVIFPQRFFVSVRVSRFQKEGERVFIFEDEPIDLGIPVDIRIVPIELTGGYRFGGGARGPVPYVGGGIGWHNYRETSDFAEDDENVSSRHVGAHVLAGLEYRLSRVIGVAGEAQFTTVPNAFSDSPTSVASAFDETNLGGVAFRVKVVIGR